MFKQLTIAELNFLQDIYKANWPKYVPTFGLLSHFIERFEKHPEWQMKVKFLTINEDTLKDGTFLMNYCNYIVFFNSLEAAPHRNLEKLVSQLDFSEEKQFWSMEIHHGEIVEKIMKLQNLEKSFDERSKCALHFLNEADITLGLEVFAKPPEGFYYDSLQESDVPIITAISDYTTPPWYFENVIKYNITTGLYTRDGKLVAWTGVHEGGESGMTNVDANYRRRKLATGVIVKHSEKMLKLQKVIFGHVFDKNEAAMQFFNDVGHVQIIGSYRWITLRKNDVAMMSKL